MKTKIASTDELSIAIVKMDFFFFFFFLFDQALMNAYELAHEFYEAHQNAPIEERDTDARIVSHADSWMRRCDSAEHVHVKKKKKKKIGYKSFDPDVILDHRLTMRENDKLFNWQN